MLYFLYAIFVLSCIVLILAVLLQPGKADAGALFTSSVSSTAFGPRGTQTLLAKITIGAAIAFMLVALALSFGVGQPRSVMEGADETTGEQTPQQQQAPAPPAQGEATTTAPAGEQPATGTSPAPADSPAANTNADASASPATNASPQGQASPGGQ
ncbi:MAG TPA: preprotein translocase subunit SecG [Pyrinomonadaceae bacterium]|nr:preprotein translocase subunit SecG [Pyrinomonadaceae bacterium]